MANVLVVMPAAAGRDVVHPVLYAPPRTHKRAPGERPDSSRYPLTPTVHPSFMPVCVLAIASGWVIMSDRFVPRSMAGRNTACGAQATGARPGRPRCRRRCHARCWWRTNPDTRMHICPVCCRCPAAYPRTRRVLALVRRAPPREQTRPYTPRQPQQTQTQPPRAERSATCTPTPIAPHTTAMPNATSSKRRRARNVKQNKKPMTAMVNTPGTSASCSAAGLTRALKAARASTTNQPAANENGSERVGDAAMRSATKSTPAARAPPPWQSKRALMPADATQPSTLQRQQQASQTRYICCPG